MGKVMVNVKLHVVGIRGRMFYVPQAPKAATIACEFAANAVQCYSQRHTWGTGQIEGSVSYSEPMTTSMSHGT